MGACHRSYDSRDREQWHALLTFVTGSCGSGARRCPHRLPRRVWTLYRLDLDPVQIETSRGYRNFDPCVIFVLGWLIYVYIQVHTMGNAGEVLFGPVGREILSFGTIVFAVFATGSQILAGQIALGSVSQVSENVPSAHNLRCPSFRTANYASCSTLAYSRYPSP